MRVNPSLWRMLCVTFCVALPACQAPAQASAAAGPSLIPAPLMAEWRAEPFTVGARVSVDPGDSAHSRSNAAWLAGLISRQGATELSLLARGERGGDIRLALESEDSVRDRFESAGLAPPDSLREAYALTVSPRGVDIRAAGEAGLVYGMVSLWQHVASLPQGAKEWPGLYLLDAPEFSWRGLMLDSARHMQSVAFIKQYLDWMALHKLNVFHWHLTDDQAWRLEIKRYPRLGDVGGFRVPAGDAPAADVDPATGEPRRYGGYYSHEQVRELVAHAALRHITVVPEIDVPGHATAAIAAYPDLGVEGHAIERVPANWGIYPNVFNLEEETFTFLEGVLREVVTLFPGPFIHLGGDEVETGQWANSPRVRARMEALGIDSLQSVQNYFVERLQAFVEPFGKRVVGWDEIIESDVPPEAVVMSWRGVEGAIEAAGKGHDTVLSPAPTLYLDHLQTAAADAPPGRGGIVTVRDVYAFDPLPDRLGETRDRVLGLQGNLWTEHVRTEARAAYMTWPRAAAIAELAWSVPAQREWNDFARRLALGVKRMRAVGIPVTDDAHALYGLPHSAGKAADGRRQDRELDLCSQGIVLALEDDAPLEGERESYLVDIMNPCWLWKDASLRGLAAIEASVGQLPFNFEIGAAIDHVVVETPRTEHGELRVRLGGCEGPVIAEASLAPAAGNPAATRLPAAPVSLPAEAKERADLCFSFTRRGVAPIWALDWVELLQEAR